MKHFFSFLICAAMLSFVACNKSDDEPYTEQASLKGRLTASMPGTPTFVQDEAGVDFNFGSDGLAIITLKGVKFAEAMPMTVDLVIDSVPYTRDEVNNTNSYSISKVVPKFNGQPMARYTITSLRGEFVSPDLFSMGFTASGTIEVSVSNMLLTNNTKSTATGTMITTLGTDSTYTKTDVVVNFSINNEFATIEMLAVKFAEAMPLTLDMTIDSVSYITVGETVNFTGNNIVPTAMGGAFPKYTITNLDGKIGDGKLSFTMMCGAYPVSYEGTLNK